MHVLCFLFLFFSFVFGQFSSYSVAGQASSSAVGKDFVMVEFGNPLPGLPVDFSIMSCGGGPRPNCEQFGTDMQATACVQNQFVSLTDNGGYLTSDANDGTWDSFALPGSWRGATASNDGCIMAVGVRTAVHSSLDFGASWIANAQSQTVEVFSLFGIAYSSKQRRYVVVGQIKIAGQTQIYNMGWTDQCVGQIFPAQSAFAHLSPLGVGRDVAYSEVADTWVAVGGLPGSQRTSVARSTDGKAWMDGPNLFVNGGRAVCAGPEGFLAFGLDATNTTRRYKSTNGTTWEECPNAVDLRVLSCKYAPEINVWVFGGEKAFTYPLRAINATLYPDGCGPLSADSRFGFASLETVRDVATCVTENVVLPSSSSGNGTFFPGNLVVNSTTVLTVTAGQPLVVVGTALINNSSALTVVASASGDLTVISAGNVVGQFGTVTAVGERPCQAATISETSYTSTTVSVTVQVDNSGCDDQGNPVGKSLSTGAIIGIAVGCAVLAILLVLLLYLLFRLKQKRTTACMNAAIAQESDPNLMAVKSTDSFGPVEM